MQCPYDYDGDTTPSFECEIPADEEVVWMLIAMMAFITCFCVFYHKDKTMPVRLIFLFKLVPTV